MLRVSELQVHEETYAHLASVWMGENRFEVAIDASEDSELACFEEKTRCHKDVPAVIVAPSSVLKKSFKNVGLHRTSGGG